MKFKNKTDFYSKIMLFFLDIVDFYGGKNVITALNTFLVVVLKARNFSIIIVL